jgi:oligopeptide/dipeptide ABC transporter ATP-binding protein
MSQSLLHVESVSREFVVRHGWALGKRAAVQAVQSVTLTVERGETLGIVGESGSGKSTLARMLVGLDRPTEGRILIGEDGGGLGRRHARAPGSSRIQYVFQDPVSALNPRHRVRAILEAPLVHLVGMPGERRKRRLLELLDAVGLRAEHLDRYPHELSGGQAQRVGLARALAAEPEIIVLDEPVSALDVSIQAQILNLLIDLKRRLGLTYVFISHDLGVVESISDRVAVMYFGRIVEIGPASLVLGKPRHPYADLLIASAPVPGRRSLALDLAAAELPDPLAPPPGCAFAPRCQYASRRCRDYRPELSGRGDGRLAACYHPLTG